jgi:phosphoribosylaminoimidazolecarboxamide formyltransferase/IMP cyclohydrolase
MSRKRNNIRAILSVSDKTGLIELGRGLAALGIELVSTGGTSRVLVEAGVHVLNVSDVTGFPEMMDGRVKTLHPKIHGGILARRDRPDDLESAAAHGIGLVDLVVVNLYPFAKAAQDASTPFEALVEEIDIGGPSLVRAAAKNFRDVLVVVDPADYPQVLEELQRGDGPTLEFRLQLMQKAFQHTARYDGYIGMTMTTMGVQDGAIRRVRETPSHHVMPRDLRYGENPHQNATWLPAHPPADVSWRIHQGKELSYNNLLDLDAAARIALEFTEPVGVVIKHTNPCGVATGSSIADAYVRAREADPLAAFGGIVGLNRTLDADTARAITGTFIEAVVAPGVSDEASSLLAAKPNLRVVTADFTRLARLMTGEHFREVRSFLGGVLMQDPDRVIEARDRWPQGDLPKVVTKRSPTQAEWTALRFAWRVCAHVKSNAVIFTTADRTAAIGAGQMSRVDAVKVAVMKGSAGSLQGTVVASDAFFPFRDGLDAVAAAGATAVVQPGGSVRDAEVVAAADEHDLAMVFTERRHFRH